MFQFNQKLTHRDKISAARGLARKRLPYFSSALFTLMPRALPGMMKKVGAGMGVTPRGIMYYDPDVVENEWDLEDIEFGILHEVGHFLREHSKRCEDNGYDAKMWNAAGDAAINDDLIAAGCKPLSTDITPDKIKHPKTKRPMTTGLTEEAYYDALRQQKNPPGGEPGARPGGGSCGGVAGNPMEGLPGDGTHSGTAGQGGRSDVEIERVRKAVAGDIKKHVEKHGRGSVPGGWSVWSDSQLTPPKIRWQDKVKRAMRYGVAKVKGQLNFHYERPSRRQWAIGYGVGKPILPSMYAPVPRIGCFVDTSGSMGAEDLELAMSEIDGVIKATGASVVFGACDAEVHGRITKVQNVKQACDMLKGGGGTHFTPVFDELAKLPRSEKPHIVIFATDGGGPAPRNPPPNMIVIWVLVGDHAEVPWVEGNHRDRIKWGTQILVKADGATPVQRAA